MESITIIATTAGFLLGWFLFDSFKPKNPVDKEIDKILASDKHKVKGKFE